MTTTATEIQKANEVYNRYFSTPRFTKELIQSELNNIESLIKKELNYSKDLRKVEYLQEKFLSRVYYKTIISKFNGR
jgi:hypothetical protein